MSGVKGIKAESNREVGTGRADVILKNPRMGRVAIFEFKCADSEKDMDKKCDEAVKQIAQREYTFPFREETVVKYGVALFKKNVRSKGLSLINNHITVMTLTDKAAVPSVSVFIGQIL